MKGIMKKYYCGDSDNARINNEIFENKNDKGNDKVEHFGEVSAIGYDIKELIFIILGGIILIFIFDLLVKAGKVINTQ